MPARKAERKAMTAICEVLPHSCFLKFFLYILLTFWLSFRKGRLILNGFPGPGTFYLIAMCMHMHYTVANTSVLQPNKIYIPHYWVIRVFGDLTAFYIGDEKKGRWGH
jgi:hypothetical protein